MKLKFLIPTIAILLIFSCSLETETVGPTENEVTEETAVTTGPISFSDSVSSDDTKIVDALVSIYAGNQRFFDRTDEDGFYNISVPSDLFPRSGFISLTILHPDYKPVCVSYELPLSSEVIYDAKDVGGNLVLCPNCLVIENENASELWHLGDNNFSGPENSQFQKFSDGLELVFNFENRVEFPRLKISFDAKGIQTDLFVTPNMISLEDENIQLTIEESPMDGSFDMYSFTIENSEELNSLKFQTTNDYKPEYSMDDYDDWEFNALSIEGIE